MKRPNQATLRLVTLLVLLAYLPSLHGAFFPSWARFQHLNGHFNRNQWKQETADGSSRPIHAQQRPETASTRATTTQRSLALTQFLASNDASNSSSSSSPWMPLYLSCLAGASTSLGAGIVFLYPQRNKSIGPNTMCFSLALAASVMITVSVVSLGPECLRETSTTVNMATTAAANGAVQQQTGNEQHYQLMPLWSPLFAQRLASFGLGCLLYRLLSYFTFPEPKELVLQFENSSNHEVGTDLQQGEPESSSLHSSQHHALPKKLLTVRSRKTSSSSPVPIVRSESSESFDEEHAHQQQQSLLVREEAPYEKSPSQTSPPLSTVSRLSHWSSGADLQNAEQRRAWRVAMLLFLSLLIHNFPEGLAVAASSVQSSKLGMAVAFGIMIHNVPEGIAIAVPCLAARPDRPWVAFLLASGSGLAEPLGAAVALLILRSTSDAFLLLHMEDVLSFVAGVKFLLCTTSTCL